MSECVVRMEMPSGCHDCKLRNMVGNCPIPMFDEQNEEKIWTLAECFQRPPWCPMLCQLPEGHGRLVDAELVKEILKPVDSISHYEPEWTWGELHEINCVAIDNAPAIVPATNTPTNTPTATERSET